MPRAEIPMEERCTGITQAGTQCKVRGKVVEGREGRLCGTHAKPVPPQCTIITRGVQCNHRVATGSQIECSYHRLSRERRERWQMWQETKVRLRNIYIARLQDHQIRFHALFETVLSTYLIQAVNHRIANPMQTDNEAVDAFPAPAVVDLVAIIEARAAEAAARMAILLAITDIPATQATLFEIKQAWDAIYVTTKVDNRLYEDMRRWWNQTSCVQQNDYLYRRLLRRLWFKIKTTESEELRTELTKRLQQECAEAFGLCCAGHINRLCNVMVGFDDRFVQEVKKGDTTVLQNRFAQIAQIEDDVEKYIQATRVIAEQGLTNEEAAPWLDSLA